MAVDLLLSERPWEPSAPDDVEEPALQLGVGEREGGGVEDLAQRTDAALPTPVVERKTKRVRIDEIELVRFVDRPFDLRRR